MVSTRLRIPASLVGALLAATMIAAGCSSGTGPATAPTKEGTPTSSPATGPTTPLARLGLHVRARVATRPQPDGPGDGFPATRPQRGLLIDYSVDNAGSGPVLVNDRIPVAAGSASGREDRVDVLKAFVLPGPDRTVTVAKRTFHQAAAPAGPDFSVMYQASVLRPGRTVTGRAFIPFPVTASVPGFASDDGVHDPLPADPAGWRFCLGITPEVYAPEVLPGGRHALISNNIIDGPREQQMLCSHQRPIPDGWIEG